MDRSTIQNYLKRYHSGQNVRIGGTNVVPSYWQWNSGADRHDNVDPLKLLPVELKQSAYQALLCKGEATKLPNPTLVEASELAMLASGLRSRYVSIRLADITVV